MINGYQLGQQTAPEAPPDWAPVVPASLCRARTRYAHMLGFDAAECAAFGVPPRGGECDCCACDGGVLPD